MNRAAWVFTRIVLASLIAFLPGRVVAQSADVAAPTRPAGLNGSAIISPTDPVAAAQANLLAGIWENRSRFVEFASDGRLRIVLKPYYGFVYEDTGWLPYFFTAGDDPAADSPFLCRLAVRYTGEKTDQLVPAAVIGDGLYVRFFRRLPDSPPTPAFSVPPSSPSGSILNGAGVADPAAGSQAAASAATALSAPTPGLSADSAIPAGSSASSGAAASGEVAASPLAGFWMAAGNADALRLYKSEPIPEFYCYYFSGAHYYRIRYWADDVRFKDVRAAFNGKDGATLTVPKFIRIGDTLYTCITATGAKLRNYESGTYALKDGLLSLAPDRVMYKGTEPGVTEPVPYALSADGALFALGAPYLSRSKVANLDAEITAHNGKRRPPRKPVFDYLDLDFHWDEVDALRNGTGPAAGKPIEPIAPLIPIKTGADKAAGAASGAGSAGTAATGETTASESGK